jgi:hypothetical protein
MSRRAIPKRQQAVGLPSPDPARSVFINCPFDPEYRPLFDAIVFATVSCKYVPRSALETGTVSDPRMDRIYDALDSSKYSIHDFSRCKGEGDNNLARFNMPLEFGIAFGKGHLKYKGRRLHDWLVLLPQGHFYKQCVSDLGAYDLFTHENTVRSVVQAVMSWLSTRDDATVAVDPDEVMLRVKDFQRELEVLRDKWSETNTRWTDIVATARRLAPQF